MSTLDLILQAVFGAFAVLGIIAGLHYRESLCCVCVRIARGSRRVQYFELDSTEV
ncbi:hypothetical protein IQ06DRAFT_297298 [Phaeosphaeriaceae sp. SRC1lsM3a]|nr:hypothetical protein IQ06DRAFT_297298 [Stagonospora sp. SRC1lsM3a]